MLSVIIITKNEEKNIEDCLNSVQFADEIIVVDNHSDDNTVNLCQKFTDKIKVTDDWPGFGPQKQRALDMASGEWVLSIDADERITESLQKEILKAINSDSIDAFNIPRQSMFCGRWIKHSGWTPDYVLRLFKREHARFSDDLVHEKIIVNSNKISNLFYPLMHYSYENMEEVLIKMNQYSSANAEKSFNNGKSSSLSKAILHGFWAFIRTYIIRAGILDGREGFILAVYNAETSYYRYIKLMYLNEKH